MIKSINERNQDKTYISEKVRENTWYFVIESQMNIYNFRTSVDWEHIKTSVLTILTDLEQTDDFDNAKKNLYETIKLANDDKILELINNMICRLNEFNAEKQQIINKLIL